MTNLKPLTDNQKIIAYKAMKAFAEDGGELDLYWFTKKKGKP